MSSHFSVFSQPKTRKRAIRAGFVVANVAVLGAVAAIVLHNPQNASSTPKAAALLTPASANQASVNPLDSASSADIALTVARMSSLPETTAITNQAQSQAATETVMTAAASSSVVSKPQVVATALKTRADIKSYTSVAGDTLASVAAKYGVTSDSIRYSNNLTAESIPAGTKLTIPPVNGIVYTVAAGDTTDSLATKYKANKDKIAAFNDAEVNGLKPGDQIVIPDGTLANNMTAAQVARGNVSAGASASTASFAWGGGAPVYGYNGYDYGYCTWYVANKLPVPSNWGNANTWDDLAPMSGWTVSKTPRPGAVAQSNRGTFGHVAVVEAVSDDGTMIKYSDMNGLAGFGRVGYSDWTSVSHFNNYIYR